MHYQVIKAGQQYYRIDGANTIWQVVSIFGDANGRHHARLFNVAEPYDMRTYTCEVLRDGRCFRLLSEDPDHGAAIQAAQMR